MKKLVKSILAGLFIALGAISSQAATTYTGNKLAGALMFAVGLSMVVVTGAELFTGKCLFIMQVMDKKMTVKEMCLSLIRIYIGNLIGSLIAVGLILNTSFHNAIDITSAGVNKCALGGTDIFFRAILCNILVCVAVYMSGKAQSAAEKVIAVLMPTATFVLCGFEHSIADMYFFGAAMSSPEVTLSKAIFVILIATVGNVIGGLLVGAGLKITEGDK